MDIMFIIDTSISVGAENFKRIKNFIKNIIRFFHIAPSHVRVGVVTYSTWVKDDFNLNTYQNLREVIKAIDKIPYVTGQQYTNRALYYLRRYSFTYKYGTRKHVASVVIAITNGKSTNLKWTMWQARLLKRKDVKIFVVAVGVVDMKGLKSIASAPNLWFIVKVPNYMLLESYAWTLLYRLYWSKSIFIGKNAFINFRILHLCAVFSQGDHRFLQFPALCSF